MKKEENSEIKNPIITNTNEEEKELNEEEEIVQQKLGNSENSMNSISKPFISLTSLSKCQCCNSDFNSNENLPILLQCSHFFVKNVLKIILLKKILESNAQLMVLLLKILMI